MITTGNHVWDQQEIIEYLDSEAPVLRPLTSHPACRAAATSFSRRPGSQYHRARVHEGLRLSIQGYGRSAERHPRPAPHHFGRLPRRGHFRKGRYGLVPERPSQRRSWDSHPCRHHRHHGTTRGNGLRHRPRHGRPVAVPSSATIPSQSSSVFSPR